MQSASVWCATLMIGDASGGPTVPLCTFNNNQEVEMKLTKKREAEIRAEIRQLAFSLVASGRIDPTKGDLDYRDLVEAYEKFSKWLTMGETYVVETTRERLKNALKKRD